MIARSLPARWVAPARLLLSCRRFTCDHLLIAADAYADLSVHLLAYGHSEHADDARALAASLRDAAPARVDPRARACPPVPFIPT
jgi:hypothetical protein